MKSVQQSNGLMATVTLAIVGETQRAKDLMERLVEAASRLILAEGLADVAG